MKINTHFIERHEMTEDERYRLLKEWNNTKVDYSKDLFIHQMFEAQAEQTPDAVAVVFEGEQLTYRELNRRANQLSHYLQSMGVGPDVLVGIAVKRSLEMVVGLYGILKTGGAYLPIDPTYPSERIAYMLEDAKVPVLLTQAKLLDKLPPHEARVICLDSDWNALIAGQSIETPVSKATIENLAYTIYTSGSTGKPKGVQVRHGAVANFLLSMAQEPGITEQDVMLAVTTLSFDIAVLELFLPLTVGAKTVVVSRDVASDGMRLLEELANSKATVMQATPSTWRLLLAAGWNGSDKLKVLCGGEAFPKDLANKLVSRVAIVWNMYGPTETTVWSTCYQLTGIDEQILIGQPIANTHIYILDRYMQPVPIGVSGELYIGGVQVARGYINRADLTAEKFIPDPFSDNPKARLYKTGDLARYLPDGNIEYIGRIDHQVKVRGFRIELGEIEAVLTEHKAVGQSVVVAREDEPGDKRLAAYIVKKPGNDGSITELRRFIQSKLPEYMVPQHIIELDALPLTPNGKIDRQALPPPENKRPELDQSYVAPQSKLERYLADIWCRILKLDCVGIHDRFFELGGNSIQAAQFIGKLQEDLSENIYIVSIFESPTIAEYTAFLQKAYYNALTEKLGIIKASIPEHADASRGAGIDFKTIEQMKEFIPTLPSYKDRNKDDMKNPPIIFILAPPRSGTTLLRVMLAGHPELFAAAELQLLGFNTLKERQNAFKGKFSLWLEGTIRTIMEIKGCDAAEATLTMEEYEKQDYTTKQFYRNLQEWIGDKILVDKSPSYVLDLKTLEKAERDFDDALYIHLVRHPYATVRSFVSYHMDQVLYLNNHPFTPQELAELVWVISHQNTAQFLRKIPDHRQFQMRFEDLVEQPKAIMEKMCHRLGLEFHPNLTKPYKEIDKKMTDGIHDVSKPMGDTKLLDHGKINPKVAESWKGVLKDNFLSDITWKAATSLGYKYPESSSDDVDGDVQNSRKHSINRRREFLKQRRDKRQKVEKLN